MKANILGSPKEKRGCYTALKTTEVLQTYYIPLPLQVERGRAGENGEVKFRDLFHQQDDIRHCVCCEVVVSNDSLGSHDGCPLSGKLGFLDCGDWAQQQILTLEWC